MGGAVVQREYNVSSTEQNRLAIDGHRIKKVVPREKGTLISIKDKDDGALYFTFSNPDDTGSQTLFVTDDASNTYQLLLQPRRVPSASIVVPAADAGRARSASRATSRSSDYQAAIKQLVTDMASSGDAVPDDAVAINQVIPLWNEARLVLVARFPADEFVGESYVLTNTSGSDMVIAEQELYRPGVAEVSVEQQTLAPGDSTHVYIVRERENNE